ncbi:MAG: hypothetical protein ABIT76_07380 [Chthoniobacterales bacterium]
MEGISYTTIAVALLTILFGGVVSALLSQGITLYRADRDRQLSKLEEIAMATQDAFAWGKQYQDLRLGLFIGTIKVEKSQHIKALVDEIDREHWDAYKRLMVLTDIWYPDLRNSAQELINSVIASGSQIEDRYRRYQDHLKNPTHPYVNKQIDESKIFEWKDTLRKQIIEQVDLIRMGWLGAWLKKISQQ